ncbi:DUF3987 domain-containing protein, partial [bacterium]|nr:DUF3987 domain-containing protein [bacterium]
IDPKNGGLISLEHWQSQYGNLLGWKVRSGGNGLHFYFNIPANLSLKNKVNLLPGIDVRGDGGYIVAPPSSHQSGNLYQWESATLDHQELPNWLIEEIEKKPITQKLNSNITVIGEGNRNNFLASIAGTLKKHQFDLNSIGKFLCYFNQEACDPSLTAEEVLSVAKSISQYHAEEEPWDEMIELPVTSYEIPLMDDSFIPISLQDWIIDVSQRMQVPFEFILVPAIVGISAIIGRKIRIYPKKNDDWMVVPNLWGAIVARPGSFKSPAIAAALRPIESLVELENQCFSKKIKNWEIDKTINEATLDAIKDQLIKSIKKNNLEESEVLKERLQNIRGQLDSNIPICKRLKTNDATVEKLIQLLLENPNGLLVIRDELRLVNFS